MSIIILLYIKNLGIYAFTVTRYYYIIKKKPRITFVPTLSMSRVGSVKTVIIFKLPIQNRTESVIIHIGSLTLRAMKWSDFNTILLIT